jgi:hypothetical protein
LKILTSFVHSLRVFSSSILPVKLERLSLATTSKHDIFLIKAGAYPGKAMSGKNTLDSSDLFVSEKNTKLAPGVNVIKLFCP